MSHCSLLIGMYCFAGSAAPRNTEIHLKGQIMKAVMVNFNADEEEEEDTADAGVTDRTTRLFQMVKDRDYDDEEEEIVDDEDDGLMPLSEEPDEMKRVECCSSHIHDFLGLAIRMTHLLFLCFLCFRTHESSSPCLAVCLSTQEKGWSIPPYRLY